MGVLVLRSSAVADPPSSGELTHGDPYTITGSYGTRSVLRDIWDNATGSSVGDLWNQSAGFNLVYTTPAAFESGAISDLPHSNVTKFIGLKIRSGTYYTYNQWLATQVSGYSKPMSVYVAAYRRHDPDWVFGSGESGTSGDNNFKRFVVSVGGEPFTSEYWYHDQTNQKGSLTSQWNESFHDSAGLMGGTGNDIQYQSNTGGSGAQSEDDWYNWVKNEYRIVLASGTGGSIRYLVNNTQKAYGASRSTDAISGTSRSIAIGVFSRTNPDTNRNLALVDVATVVGVDAFKRVMLTDNATYSSSTITEFQPITTWNGDVEIVVNKGALSTGTAHLHIFDASDSGTYVGPVTLT